MEGQTTRKVIILAAVALAGRSRQPVLIGEAKWSKQVSGTRVVAGLAAKASSLTNDVASLRFAICARDQVTGAMVVTAADIFAP